jgi:hypothetical protein
MVTKVRDIVGTAREPFKGSLARAIGQHTGPAEFSVVEYDGTEKRVCMGHLTFQVRESIIKTGCSVMVSDAVTGGECRYERLA